MQDHSQIVKILNSIDSTLICICISILVGAVYIGCMVILHH